MREHFWFLRSNFLTHIQPTKTSIFSPFSAHQMNKQKISFHHRKKSPNPCIAMGSSLPWTVGTSCGKTCCAQCFPCHLCPDLVGCVPSVNHWWMGHLERSGNALQCALIVGRKGHALEKWGKTSRRRRCLADLFNWHKKRSRDTTVSLWFASNSWGTRFGSCLFFQTSFSWLPSQGSSKFCMEINLGLAVGLVLKLVWHSKNSQISQMFIAHFSSKFSHPSASCQRKSYSHIAMVKRGERAKIKRVKWFLASKSKLVKSTT